MDAKNDRQAMSFGKKPLWEVSMALTATATGREAADTVITGARLVNVCTGEILPGTDIAIREGRIALVGDASSCIGPDTCVIPADGQYVAPGFLDGHIHVESSMLTMREYARAVVPHGTVGIYMDPHEIANVLGLEGVRLMCEEADLTPLKAMVTIPSCVPAVPGFEDTGAAIGPEDIADALSWDGVVGLGEMMNYPAVCASDPRAHRIVGETLRADKIATGHYAAPDTGAGLNAYAAAGLRCCHESTTADEALAKMRLGMYAQLREGSAWHDLHAVAPSITGHAVDARFACLVSDDAHPHTLVAQGHLDHILRRAVEEGIPPVTAVQMVTINCAQCFRMDHELGSITPGKCADIVFLRDLQRFEVTRVLIDGAVVAEDGALCVSLPAYSFPERALHTMHVGGTITPDSFAIPAQRGGTHVRVIEIIPERVSTRTGTAALPVKDGCLQADPAQDVLKAAVFERHRATGHVGFGFVRGFGIRRGAMASTVAHDAHNLLVVGTTDADMALAANTLIGCGGGLTVVQDGRVLGLVSLPVAGLMEPARSAAQMSDAVAALEDAWAAIGCRIASPFMTMALIPLACLPELRLTDRGLVDSVRFTFVPLED